MTDPLARLRRFLQELKRRNVYRVAVTYAVVGFVLIQVADLTFVRLGLPSWTVTFVIVLVAVGFPLALIVAWAFEMTPEGVRRTPEAEPLEPGPEPTEDRPSRSHLAVKALVGLGLVGVAAAGGWYLMGSGGESPGIEERTVAVLPFQVSGSGAETWRDGMVTYLTPGLDGAAGLRAIPDRTVFAAWEERGEGDDDVSADEALTVAREIGAQYAVIGSAGGLGSEVRFAVEVYGTESRERLGQAEVRGSPESVPALADSLARRLVGVLLEGSGRDMPSVDLGRITTRSLPALKAYLNGERHFRAGEYGAAIQDYESAVEADSTFALAHARLAQSHAWLVEFDHSRRYIKRARSLSDRLPEREGRIIGAEYLRRVERRQLAAADTLRRLAADYPDDPTVWYKLGETVFHGSIPRGWPEAETAFGRAVELDPDMAPYHHHYVALAMSLHRDSAMAARRIAAHPSGRWKKAARNSWTLLFGSPEGRQEILSALDSVPLDPFALHHPLDRELWIRVVREKRFGGAGPGVSLFTYPAALISAGRVRAGLAAAREASWSPGDMACLLADARSLELPVPDSLIRRFLEPAQLPEDAFVPSVRSVPRLWCTALHAIEWGADEVVPELMNRIRSVFDSLEARGVPEGEAEVRLDELRGYRAWKDGGLERAASFWSSSNAGDRAGAIWRGDLFRELDQSEKAEGWYLAAWRDPVAHERLGRLYEEVGRLEEAAAAYRRFIVAWEDADEALQPRVERARERLTALTDGGAAAR